MGDGVEGWTGLSWLSWTDGDEHSRKTMLGPGTGNIDFIGTLLL